MVGKRTDKLKATAQNLILGIKSNLRLIESISFMLSHSPLFSTFCEYTSAGERNFVGIFAGYLIIFLEVEKKSKKGFLSHD